MKQLFALIIFFLNGSFLFAQNPVIINDIPRDTSYTVYSSYVKEVKKRSFIKIVEEKDYPDLKVYENIIYSHPYEGRELKLDIYRPDDNEEYPVLIMVHGGGWSSGDKSMQVPLAKQIAKQGYVTIPVEYRLSPEALYPAAVYDLKTAIRWIRANADEYNIDTSKIAISGCSAGGQLAALIGTTNGQEAYENKTEYPEYSSDVNAIISVDGISDFTTSQSIKASLESLAKNKIPASIKWLGGTFEEKKDVWIFASSVYHVTEYSVPICFINSSIDRFHDGRDEIIEKLNEHNIYTEVHTLPDTPHTFWLFEQWFDTTVGYMVNYLDRLFKE